MLTTLAIENYRSLRDVVVPLGRLTAVTGTNGSGKSSLYRALRLLAESSRNGAVAALAREGGLPSTLWAGPERVSRGMHAGEHPVQGTRRRGPVSLRLGFASDDFGYALDLGLPVPGPSPEDGESSAFDLDPEIKRECTWGGPVARPAALLSDRRGGIVRVRDENGGWQLSAQQLHPFDSMLSELSDPERAPEVLVLRERIRSWRFYDHFRTDAAAPARTVQIGTRTPVLGHDGADLEPLGRRSSRSATWRPCTKCSSSRFPAVLSKPSRTRGCSRCFCANRGCCDRSPWQSSPTAPCASCFL